MASEYGKGLQKVFGVSVQGYKQKTSQKKRTLGVRDKKILYRNAGKRCENPKCKRKIDFDEMQVGHKNKAYSKGGTTSIKNSVCLCYRCNNLQGTDSWETFLKKQGIKVKKKEKTKTKKIKQNLPKSKSSSSYAEQYRKQIEGISR